MTKITAEKSFHLKMVNAFYRCPSLCPLNYSINFFCILLVFKNGLVVELVENTEQSSVFSVVMFNGFILASPVNYD